MLSKKKVKMEMLKQGINDEQTANIFMDKVVNKLDNNALRRAYNSSVIKHNQKQTKNTEYMVNYFKRKLEERNMSYR